MALNGGNQMGRLHLPKLDSSGHYTLAPPLRAAGAAAGGELMTDLSPAAQAILHEFWGAPVSPTRNVQIAAALRAAADQVVPSDTVEPRNYLPMAMECQRIRSELLAIAAELEAQ